MANWLTKLGPATVGHTDDFALTRRGVAFGGTVPPLLPGLFASALVTVVALRVNDLVPQLSALTFAVFAGVAIGNIPPLIARLKPGFVFASRKLLKIGVAFLGVRLSIGQALDLGLPTLALVAFTVVATFFGTQKLGRWLGLSPGLSLLVATGYSICGASAIAAMESSSDAEEEEVAASIGLVTIAGTLAMIVLPFFGTLFGLSESQYGSWVGASVHDVAQVTVAASAVGTKALAVAVVVKLSRVLLLAPLITGVNIAKNRKAGSDTNLQNVDRPPLIPIFVAGFLLLMVLRSSGFFPDQSVDLFTTASSLLLTAALVGLGSEVQIRKLYRLGIRPLVLGGLAWILVAGVSLALTLVVVA